MFDEAEVNKLRQLHESCEAAVREQRWNDALLGFERLLPLLEAAGDVVGAARVHLRMGQLLEELSQPVRAGDHYLQAEELAEKLNDGQLRAAALHRRGHLVRTRDPQLARLLFQASLDQQADDSEANALSLAMIGQIDFTDGNEPAGLDAMLQALDQMPADSPAFQHLVEHIVYFGGKLNRADFVHLVNRRITDKRIRGELMQS